MGGGGGGGEAKPDYEISISEDPAEYNRQQIQELLRMIDIGNRVNGGLTKVCSAYGILGFIRFLHGHYIILITKRRKVGMIGCHFVYGIDDISYIYVPPYFPKNQVQDSVDIETKYKTLFLGLDLTRDFYFSYTYDLTHTLQYNVIRGARGEYNDMFVWNHHLLKSLTQQVSPLWILPIIHGFYAQSKTSVFGRSMDFILIARRSRNFAGTRFLKRGINTQGHVANDVETEQIVQYPLNGVYMRFSSYVQVRGSIPLYWAQDNSMMAPKPPIIMMRMDPFYGSTIRHFKDLIGRYGSPVVILNLVKSKEKKPREGILRGEFGSAVEFLNSTLPSQHAVEYHAWDFHYAAKSKTEDHLGWLANFATAALDKTSLFVSGLSTQCGIVRTNCIDSLDRTNAAQYMVGKTALMQQLIGLGVAGPVSASASAADGLYYPTPPPSPSATSSSSLDFDPLLMDAANPGGEFGIGAEVLLDMYEALGNQIALQYGGSELANTMKTYTKHSLSSQSRDLFNAIRRYYSNSFTDAEKQHSINLFLGTFIPSNEAIALWNIETDYYIHNKLDAPEHLLLANTNWWDDAADKFKKNNTGDGCKDFDYEAYYSEIHHPYKLTFFDKYFSYRFNIPLHAHHQQQQQQQQQQLQQQQQQQQGKDEEQQLQGIKKWVFAWKKPRQGTAKKLKFKEKRKPNLPLDHTGKDKPLGRFGMELEPKPEDIDYYRRYVASPMNEQSSVKYYDSYLEVMRPNLAPHITNMQFYKNYHDKYISRSFVASPTTAAVYNRYCSIVT